MTKDLEKYEDNAVTDLEANVDIFKNQKEMLLQMISTLSNGGIISDLVENENKTREYMNSYLPLNGAKLEPFLLDELIERIKSFDMNKEEDIELMLLYKRHFANKLAHAYTDYMFAYMYEWKGVEKENNTCLRSNLNNSVEDYLKKKIFLYNKLYKEKRDVRLKEVREPIQEFLKKDLTLVSNDEINRVFIEKLDFGFNYTNQLIELANIRDRKVLALKISTIISMSEASNNYGVNVNSVLTEDIKSKLLSAEVTEEEKKCIIDKILKDISVQTKRIFNNRMNQNPEYNKVNNKLVTLSGMRKNKIVEFEKSVIEKKRQSQEIIKLMIETAKLSGKNVDNFDFNMEIEKLPSLGLTDEDVRKNINKAWMNIEGTFYKTDLSKIRKVKDTALALDKNSVRYLMAESYKRNYAAKSGLNNVILAFEEDEVLTSKSREEYCQKILTRFCFIMDKFQNSVNRMRMNGDDVKDFTPNNLIKFALYEDLLKKDEYISNESEIIRGLKGIFYKKGLIEVSAFEELRNLRTQLVKDGMFYKVEAMLTNLARQYANCKALFDVKQNATMDLLYLASKDKERLFVEGYAPNENHNGLFNIYVNGVPQTNACHCKYGEIYEEDPLIAGVKPEDTASANAYKEVFSNGGLPLNTFVPQPELTNEQAQAFKETLRIMGYIEGRNNLSDGVLKENQELEKDLRNLLENKPDSYYSLRTRFLLGAGIEYYKAYRDEENPQRFALLMDMIQNDRNVKTNVENGKAIGDTTGLFEAFSYQEGLKEGQKIQDRISDKENNQIGVEDKN